MKEGQPIPEKELGIEKEMSSICGGCGQEVNIEDFEKEREDAFPVRYKDEMFHFICLKRKVAQEEDKKAKQ